MLFGAVFPRLLRTVEKLGSDLAGLLLDRNIRFRSTVRKKRPADSLAVAPNVCVGLVLVLSHQMTGFVQKYHRTLGIIDRFTIEIRIKRDDLKWKIRRRVGVLFLDKRIQPVIRAAKRRRAFEEKNFVGKSAIGEQLNRTVDLLPFYLRRRQ